ncbi:MAG: TIGR04086 family membrane protein [Oscillospiraceae bacterium]|nr:TIGR04086 family membrane protein [Oscillospiraceae bacterium]
MRSFRRGVLLVGVPVSTLLLLAGAAAATAKEFSAVTYAVWGAIALTTGGFFAALYHCRVHRHSGLLHGMLCGLSVTAFWFFVAWLMNGHAGFGFPVLWGMLGGMAGGIYGVNLPAPAAKKQSHCSIHIHEHGAAFADACRKRRYRKPWQMPEKSTSDADN